MPRLSRELLNIGTDPRDALRAILLRRYEAQRCALYGSATQALQAAITHAVSLNGGGRVLLPAYTCYEVATAAVGARSAVALYDVDPATLEPDWDSVRALRGPHTAALVVTPLFGLPVDWAAARELTAELGGVLIGDVAQAFGATWDGKPSGSSADITILSFGRGKGWTGAGGGALLARGAVASGLLADDTGTDRGDEARCLARAVLQWVLGRRSVYGIPASLPFLHLGETIYHDPVQPQGMTRTSAAMLLANDDAAMREVLHRRSNAGTWSSWFHQASRRVTAVPGARLGGESGALRYPIRVRGGWEWLRTTGAARLGAASGYPKPLHALAALQPRLQATAVSLAGAELLARELVTLPTHSGTTLREMERLRKLLRSDDPVSMECVREESAQATKRPTLDADLWAARKGARG